MELKRRIGYIKQDLEIELISKKDSHGLEIEGILLTIESRSKKITEWINSHPAIKWSVICKNAGIDKGNFQRILKSKNPIIKIENIVKLERELKKYGYE
jgi:hypothetical protein